MQIIRDPSEASALCRGWRFSGTSTVLVPTMGFFHAGHQSLMACGRSLGERLVVSLFVNPAQFGPGEDLGSYPRDFERDADIARQAGVDVLFAPEASAMYAADHATWVDVPNLGAVLCGASRQGHFRGVCTIVSKLFMLLLPSVAVFGEKDWQQLALIRRMSRDLNFPVRVLGQPTVRESDGLALSSRNAYLSATERMAAPNFYKGLQQAAAALARGQRDTAELASLVRAFWAEHLPQGKEEYLSFVHPDTLAPIRHSTGPCLVAAAMRLGRARLIDNLTLHAV